MGIIKPSASCDEYMMEYAKMPRKPENSLVNIRALSIFFTLAAEANREALGPCPGLATCWLCSQASLGEPVPQFLYL